MSDIRVVGHGTVAQFHLLTKPAVDWMVENLHYESWQMMGPNVLAVDHGYVLSIIEVARQAGLSVEVTNV